MGGCPHSSDAGSLSHCLWIFRAPSHWLCIEVESQQSRLGRHIIIYIKVRSGQRKASKAQLSDIRLRALAAWHYDRRDKANVLSCGGGLHGHLLSLLP